MKKLKFRVPPSYGSFSIADLFDFSGVDVKNRRLLYHMSQVLMPPALAIQHKYTCPSSYGYQYSILNMLCQKTMPKAYMGNCVILSVFIII